MRTLLKYYERIIVADRTTGVTKITKHLSVRESVTDNMNLT